MFWLIVTGLAVAAIAANVLLIVRMIKYREVKMTWLKYVYVASFSYAISIVLQRGAAFWNYITSLF
ncbi:hypothetical protein ACFL3C_03875 [Patescibacteria group bacterium]